MAEIIKAPWDAKPGIEHKLEIDESEQMAMFDDFDEDEVLFDESIPENDMVFDYKAARKNAHFCVHASKKILNMIAHNLTYERNPLVADACVKLVKVIAENNRDLIKIHKDFKSTKLIGKPVGGDEETAIPESEREETVKTTVSEVIAAAQAQAQVKNNREEG